MKKSNKSHKNPKRNQQKIHKNWEVKKKINKFENLTKIKKSEEKKKMFLKKNAILLVLPIEEITLRLELSSPPCFRIQKGVP